MTFITEIEILTLKFIWKHDGPNMMNSQGNIKQIEQHWNYHNTQLQAILQSCSNKNGMVLAQKQT
jgi:hypothetical protein